MKMYEYLPYVESTTDKTSKTMQGLLLHTWCSAAHLRMVAPACFSKGENVTIQVYDQVVWYLALVTLHCSCWLCIYIRCLHGASCSTVFCFSFVQPLLTCIPRVFITLGCQQCFFSFVQPSADLYTCCRHDAGWSSVLCSMHAFSFRHACTS